MTSLNAFLPVLSEIVGASQGVLYERQRSLVQIGLLESLQGRGPGSGVRLSPHTVAVLLLAYAGTDSLAEVRRTERVCAASFFLPDSHSCPVTGKSFLSDILIAALAEPELASRIPRIQIELNSNLVRVSYFASRRGAAPRHYELFIPEEDARHPGVLKQSILTDLDKISLALAEFRKPTEKPE